MDINLFKRGINDIVRDKITDTVAFHILGEPMLYPQIFEALNHAGDMGLKTDVTANSSLLMMIIIPHMKILELCYYIFLMVL